MGRIEIRDLEIMARAGDRISLDGFLLLSNRAFIKEHAYKKPGTTLVAPQLGFTRDLNQQDLMMVELLDGTKSLPEIEGILARRLGRQLQEIKQACADFIGRLRPYGLIRSSKNRKQKAVRRVRQCRVFSLETVQLVLTHECNMSCIYCSNSEYRQEMGPELCDKVVESMISMGVNRVALTGGEPTLHPQFWDITGELSRNGMAVIVYTNGSTLTSHGVERLAKLGVSQVCLSVDSLEERDLKKLGQKHINPAHLISVIGSLQNAGVGVRTNTALVPGINCFEAKAEHLYETLGDLNVSVRAFCEVIPEGRGRAYPPRREVFDVAAMLGRKLEACPSCEQSESEDQSESVRMGMEQCVPQTICGVGTRLTSIYPDGRVIPCICMTDIVAGNMTQASLEDIWESGNGLELFRSRDNFESPICRRCPDWKRCQGGCKAKARMYGGSLNSPDLWSCACFGHVRRAKQRFSERCITAFSNRPKS